MKKIYIYKFNDNIKKKTCIFFYFKTFLALPRISADIQTNINFPHAVFLISVPVFFFLGIFVF